MMAVSMTPGKKLRPGPPRRLFEGYYSSSGVDRSNYDIATDGSFLMISNNSAREIRVVINWSAELARIAPTALPASSASTARPR